jgi:ribose 5-phosphate isomerase A
MSAALLQSSFAQRGAQRAFTSATRAPKCARISAARMTTRALSQDELKQQVRPLRPQITRPRCARPGEGAHPPPPPLTPRHVQAAWKAVDYVKSGMVVGLGTGSTAAFAVDRIGALLKSGELKDIVAVPTSVRTYEQALSLGIPLATLDEQPKLDVAIDGADEVDPALDVVKGRGGALLREKMVEMASAKFVCIVDESKMVEGLGGSKLAMPVEITQFCHLYTLRRLAALPEVAGCEARLRMEGDAPYVTDNHNFIVDLYFQTPIKDSHAASRAILALEGVVDHGLFLDMVDVCIIAGSDGVEVRERK